MTLRDEPDFLFVGPEKRLCKQYSVVNLLAVGIIDKCAHELVEVKALFAKILNAVKLLPKQVIRYLEFNAYAGAVPPISLPKNLLIRRTSEAGQTDLVATLLDHVVDYWCDKVL